VRDDEKEQERRRDFEMEWRRQAGSGGSVNMLLQEAAGIFAGFVLFKGSKVEPLHNLKLTLHVPFNGARGTFQHFLKFKPDEQKQRIIYTSSLPGSEPLTCDMHSLNECAEGAVRSFFKVLIANLSGKADEPFCI
jgi:hypothetical protein